MFRLHLLFQEEKDILKSGLIKVYGSYIYNKNNFNIFIFYRPLLFFITLTFLEKLKVKLSLSSYSSKLSFIFSFYIFLRFLLQQVL